MSAPGASSVDGIEGSVDPALIAGVDVLCLDAGNTVVFFDHERLARICRGAGFATDARALCDAEGVAKRAQEEGSLVRPDWSGAHFRAARSWAAFIATMLHAAGLAFERLPSVLEEAWVEHTRFNLWGRVPDGLVKSLDAARASGVRVVIVSNSEGKLASFLNDVGVLTSVDHVIDSGLVGFEKPDPRIFEAALAPFGAPPSRALHLGDIFATDVLGARAAGIRVALVDPHGHLRGRHPDVPRVRDAAGVATALAAAAGRR